ncbi:UNVERIFIED_CONTAM: Magnesium protoporphyrin IX methyltransferase, chloroplastic [Sesamum radiatum]|uniref:Magnesium protoporphyrin IX methyltransferase, chloroplastic n=1 Tax=Sesamum radiatum TaxID=300843 RepID=A0AAW2VJQ4_SESRA
MAFSSMLFSPVNFTVPRPHCQHHRRRPFSITAAIPPLSSAEVSAVSETFDSTTIAVIGGGSVAALAAALSLADPEKRRQMQAEEVGGGDKEVVREYFNNDGFQRWRRIYGDTDDVNKEGAVVAASDISAAMVAEAEKQAREELFKGKDALPPGLVLPKFEVKDLESLDGKYDTVVCLDVLIHYPQNKADAMIAHLASLAKDR